LYAVAVPAYIRTAGRAEIFFSAHFVFARFDLATSARAFWACWTCTAFHTVAAAAPDCGASTAAWRQHEDQPGCERAALAWATPLLRVTRKRTTCTLAGTGDCTTYRSRRCASAAAGRNVAYNVKWPCKEEKEDRKGAGKGEEDQHPRLQALPTHCAGVTEATVRGTNLGGPGGTANMAGGLQAAALWQCIH